MKTGFLLVQLGSPRTPSVADVRDYLIEFLGDPLVVKPRPLFWTLLLRLVIAPRRAPHSALLYKEMLDAAEGQEMPLVRHTRAFAEAIQKQVGTVAAVAYCFQYGSEPSPATAIQQLIEQGCTDICVIPLYPQRAGATTDAACAGVERIMRALKSQDIQAHWHRGGFAIQEFWVQAQADLIAASVQNLALPPTDIVFSFHGYPAARIAQGDPYEQDCQASARAITANLRARKNWPRDLEFHTAYQSRFGRQRWLEPSTADTLQTLGRHGSSVLVVCPSFTTDNLETLVEVDHELRDQFFSAGGRAWDRVPCLNAIPAWTTGFARWLQSLFATIRA